jgi:hypothetical protein
LYPKQIQITTIGFLDEIMRASLASGENDIRLASLEVTRAAKTGIDVMSLTGDQQIILHEMLPKAMA